MAISKKIKGLLVEIGGDTSSLEKALKDVDKSTANLSKELKGINTLLKFDPSNTNLLNQKTQVLSESIEETEKKLKALKDAQKGLDASGLEKNTSEYRNLQREIEVTSQKLSTLKLESSNWTKAGKKIEEFGMTIEKVGNKVSSVGNILTVGLTLPIVALGTAVAKSAIEFESAFAGVLKTVDGTEKQLTDLRQGIIDLSERIPASTTEISAVAEAAGQLGIATNDVLEFTEVMINLGESTNLSSTEAASALAKFANITGMVASDYSKLGSVIVDLGNNFATTENDIVQMATRLAATGELAGLSEAQILALATAMSSVGIEAEAGGSAMSKLLKKIQISVETGNSSLKQFASVAGVTSTIFKKAFEEDAVNALSMFIAGLNDTERNGKSAIVLLEDMGLTEVRLSNTILSLANSSNVLTDAIGTANNAWEENTALTEEAEKRYATTQSQMDIAKNKINNIAIELGSNLLPHINKALDKIGDLIDKFSNLSEEEQKNILKNIALVAAIGPVIKIIGTLITIGGKVTTAIGTVSQAIGVLRTGAESASKSANSLAKFMSNLASPIGIATVAITLLTAAYAANEAKKRALISANKDLITEMTASTTAYKENLQSIYDQTNADMTQIRNTERLYNELSKLVDENGKVKSGYEDRANFIATELNSALGTEITLTDGIINNYQKLQEEITKTITLKKAEIYLNSLESEYTESLKNSAEVFKELSALESEYIKQQTELNRLQNAFDNMEYNALNALPKVILNDRINTQKQVVSETQKAFEDLKGTYNYGLEIQRDYENAVTLLQSDDIEAIQEWLNKRSITYKNLNGEMEQQYNLGIQQYSYNISQYKKLYSEALKNQDSAATESNRIQITAQEEALNSLVDNMLAQTSTINRNSPEIIEAWKTLATNSKEKYHESLMSLDEDLRNTIVKMTGVVYDETTAIASSFSTLAITSKDEYETIINEMPNDMKGNIIAIANAIVQNSGTVTDKTKNMMDKVLEEMDRSKDSETTGKNFLAGINKGLSNKSSLKTMLENAGSIASNLLNKFKSMWDINSPSKEASGLTINFIKGLELGFEKEEANLLNQADKLANNVLKSFNIAENIEKLGSIQGDISQKITDATKTIFTTPNIIFNVQEMDDKNLNKAIEYINNKWGSQY